MLYLSQLSKLNVVKRGDNLSFDYSRLRGKIKEKCKTQERFANMLNISPASLSDKLNEKAIFPFGDNSRLSDSRHSCWQNSRLFFCEQS